MKQVVPAVRALPRAAGSITTLLGFCLRSCTKRTFPWMHTIPFLIPHVLQQLFQPWGHSRSMGYVPAGCSNSDLKLQRRRGSLLPLGLFCWQSRFPARCLPTQRLTPAQAGGTGAHVHWDTCRSTEDAPPSPMPRSMLLINWCSQLCTVPTSVPWSCLVSALEGHIRTSTNGLHGYPCMCFPSWRPFPTSLSSDVTIPSPETMGRDKGSHWHGTREAGTSLPLLHVIQGTRQRHQTSPLRHEFPCIRVFFRSCYRLEISICYFFPLY